MAKSASKKIPLTPAEAAAQKAARVVELRAEIAAKGEEAATLLEELSDYCDEHGIASGDAVGPLQAVRKSNPVKLVGDGLTPKETDYAKEQLMHELPDFVKRSLDTTKMYNALRTNTHVANALNAKGLALVQDVVWTFKAA